MNKEFQFQIRLFRKEDQRTVRQLILEGLGEHFDNFDADRNPDLDSISKYYLEAGHYFAVIELDETLIGTGALINEAAATARIVRVSVGYEYRHQGLGTAMVMHLIQEARRRNYSSIVAETNHDWWAATALYEKCGFAQYARDEESIHMVRDL